MSYAQKWEQQEDRERNDPPKTYTNKKINHIFEVLTAVTSGM
jgi:hypothetical protein